MSFARSLPSTQIYAHSHGNDILFHSRQPPSHKIIIFSITNRSIHQFWQHLQDSYSWLVKGSGGRRGLTLFDPWFSLIICLVRSSKRAFTLCAVLALVSMKGTWYLLAAYCGNYPTQIPPHRRLLFWHSCLTYYPQYSTPLFGPHFYIPTLILAHLVVPVGHILEALAVSDIVYDDYPTRITVVGVSDCSKSVLPCSIPLNHPSITSASFTLSPSKSTILVFWVGWWVQSQLQWCWAGCLGIDYPKWREGYWEADE